jgi:hypothetical protein
MNKQGIPANLSFRVTFCHYFGVFYLQPVLTKLVVYAHISGMDNGETINSPI